MPIVQDGRASRDYVKAQRAKAAELSAQQRDRIAAMALRIGDTNVPGKPAPGKGPRVIDPSAL